MIYISDKIVRLVRRLPINLFFLIGQGFLPKKRNPIALFLLRMHAYIKFYLLLPYAKWSVKFHRQEEIADVKFMNYRWQMFCKGGAGEVDLHLLISGAYEEEVSYYFTKLSAGKDMLLDIGANIGYYTMLGYKANMDMKIHSFEPMRQTYGVLKKNVDSINSQRNITAYQTALGSSSSHVRIEQKADSGHNSLLPTKNPSTGRFEEIEVKRLADVLSVTGKKILFKIDAEGYEFEVLQGAEQILDNNECTIILEFTPSFFRHLSKDADKYSKHFLNFLVNKGFRIYELDKFWTKPIDNIDLFIKNIGIQQTYLIASNFDKI